ncbi:MAG: Ig-like domain-containing protein, partial [Nitrososphaera sp.]
TVGHKVVRDIIFVADNTGPQLNVRNPEDESVVRDVLEFEIEAADSSLKTISVMLPNGTSIENNNAFSIDTSSLAEGEYKVVIRAEDGAGNVVEEERKISVDRTAPVVEISSPEDGSTVSGRINVNYEVNDDNLKSLALNLKSPVLNIGEKSVEISNTGSYSLDTATLFDDKYTLELVAEDKAGNVNSKAVMINTANFGPSLMNVWIFGILIGAAIGAGIAVAVLMSKYRSKRTQPQPEPQPQTQQDL